MIEAHTIAVYVLPSIREAELYHFFFYRIEYVSFQHVSLKTVDGLNRQKRCVRSSSPSFSSKKYAFLASSAENVAEVLVRLFNVSDISVGSSSIRVGVRVGLSGYTRTFKIFNNKSDFLYVRIDFYYQPIQNLLTDLRM